MAKDIKVRLYSNSKQFNSEMSSISRQMKVVKSEFESNRTSVQNWGNQLKQSEAKIKYLNQSIDLQKRRVSELRKAYNDSANAKGKDAKQTQTLATRLNRATAELNKMQGQLKTTNAELKRFGQQQAGKKLEQDLKSLSNEAKRIDNQFKLAKTSSKNFGNEMKQTGLEAERLKQQISVQGNVLKRLEQEYKRVWSEKRKNTAEARNLANAIDQERIKLNGLQNSLTQTTAKMKQMNAQSKQSASSMNQFGSKMNHAGMEMRRMGMGVSVVAGTAFATLTAGLTSAYKATANFEQGVSKVQAVSGASASEIKKLDKQARDLGASTKFTATQAAEGMEKLALAGWKANDIMAGMPGMLNLAAAGNLDLATAADITSDTMSAFGLSADKAGHSADVFAYAQANANTNVEQMGEAMKYAAPVANALGWELEETAAAQMALADAGIKGSLAGQAFATSLARLAKPTSAMKKEMKKLGMEFFDAEGNMKPLPKVMAEIEKGTEGMTREQRSATLTTLFGAQAYKHWAILLEEGSSSLERTTNELKNSDGAAKEMADTMMDNAAGAVISFQSAIEGLQISLTRHLIPAFTNIVEKATSIVRGFTNLDESTQKTIITTTAFGTAVLGVTTVVAGLTAAVGAFLTFAGPVGLAIAGGTAALGALATAAFGAAQHTKNLEEKQRKLAEEQDKAKQTAIRYGEGISEGTRKGVKGYIDLYEGAKLEMHKLKGMSGEEAEKTKQNVVKAFQDMGDQVVSQLKKFASEFETVVKEIYGVYEDEGKKRAEQINKQVQSDVEKTIKNYEGASKRIAEIVNEFGADVEKYPPKIRETYEKNLAIMQEGVGVFAVSYEDALAVRNRIVENKDKILVEESGKYLKEIEKTHTDAQKNINEQYNSQKEVIEQFKVLYPENAAVYDEMMKALATSTTAEYAKIDKVRLESTQALYEQTDTSGRLIDLQTGKILERKTIEEEMVGHHGMVTMKRAETDEEYYARYVKTSEAYLQSLEGTSKRSMEVIEKDAYEWALSMGKTETEARKFAKDIKNGALEELDKDKDKAKKSGKDKGDAHKKGLEDTKGGNKKAGEDVKKSADDGLKKGKEEAGKHGKEKGQKHKKGLESTKGENKKAADGIKKYTDDGLKQGGPQANKHGKDKGTKHKQGLESTRGANQGSANALSRYVSSSLGKTTDGGGGKKAGTQFSRGLGGMKGAASSSGKSVASSGERGLRSVNTSGAGSGFVSGFVGAIGSGRGSVWSTAWNLGKTALSALKKSIDSHSPSKETQKEGKNFADGASIGIKKNTKKVSASAKAMGAAATKAASEKLKNLQVKFDTKKMDASRYKAELRKIQVGYKLTGDQARKVQKEMHKANQAILKQANERKKALNKINQDVKSSNSAYLKSVRSINSQLSKDIKQAESDYKKKLSDLRQSLYSQTGLFDKVEPKEIDPNQLLGNLKDQNKQFKQFNADILKLQKSGVSGKFVDELRKMGVSAADEVHAIANMPKSMLKDYVKAWSEKHKLAKAESEKQMAGEKAAMIKQIRSLQAAANKELDKAKSSWQKSLNKISKDTAKLGSFKNSGHVLGKNTAQGLIKGLKSMQGPLESAARSLAKTIEKEIRKELKIKSPSRKMEKDIGPFVPIGVARGIRANLKHVVAASKDMAKAAVPDFSDTALVIDAAAKEIRANKDKFIVEHSFKSGSLEQKVEGLESTINKLTDFLEKVMYLQQNQLQAVANRDIVIDLNGREVARGTYKDVKEFQQRDDKTLKNFRG